MQNSPRCTHRISEQPWYLFRDNDGSYGHGVQRFRTACGIEHETGLFIRGSTFSGGQEGGYTPGLDHSMPPDVPFANICCYMEQLRDAVEL